MLFVICFFESLQYHQNLIAKTDHLVYIPSNLQCWDFHNPSLYDKRSIDRSFLEVNPADYVCHNIQHLPILFLQSVSTILKPYLFVEDRKVPADCHASGHQQFFIRSFCNNSIISFILFLIGNARQRFALSGSAVCYLNLNVFIGKIKALFRKRFAHCS